jgi:hypothetical protein
VLSLEYSCVPGTQVLLVLLYSPSSVYTTGTVLAVRVSTTVVRGREKACSIHSTNYNVRQVVVSGRALFIVLTIHRNYNVRQVVVSRRALHSVVVYVLQCTVVSRRALARTSTAERKYPRQQDPRHQEVQGNQHTWLTQLTPTTLCRMGGRGLRLHSVGCVLAVLLLPMVSGRKIRPTRRALQAVAVTDANLAEAVAQCLSESATGDCPNSPYGYPIGTWDTSAVTDMSYSARSLPHLQLRALRSHAPRTETERPHIIVWLAWRAQCFMERRCSTRISPASTPPPSPP